MGPAKEPGRPHARGVARVLHNFDDDSFDPCIVLCSDDDGAPSIDPPKRSIEGESRLGWFHYLCIDASRDASCISTTSDDAWPAAIAVGATFDVEYLHDAGGAAPVSIAAPSLLDRTSDGLAFESAAIVRLLVGADVAVFDSIHVRGRTVDRQILRPQGEAATNATSMVTGDAIDLVVTPLDASGKVLAGALDYEWSSSDAAIVAIEPDGAVGPITALAVGEAAVTVTGGGLSVELLVSVGEVGP